MPTLKDILKWWKNKPPSGGENGMDKDKKDKLSLIWEIAQLTVIFSCCLVMIASAVFIFSKII